MTDLEISKALALAIGWKDHDIDPDVITIRDAYKSEPELHCWDKSVGLWRIFNYRDWNVIGPIAAKYDAFPCRVYNGWRSMAGADWTQAKDAPTAQLAIALAVIGAKK